MQLGFLLILLGLTASAVVATPVELSNAERIQRGLPLKAPTRRYDPTRTNNLRARASVAPLTQAPGSAFIQVTRQFPGKKRQSTTLGYLSYNSATGTFQVGSSGSAVSFAPPMPNLQNGGIEVSSPELFGQNFCANTVVAGPNGKRAAVSYVPAIDPPPGQDYNTIQCFGWTFNRQTLRLTGRNQWTRDPYTFAVDPATTNLYGWTGTAESELPPAAERVILTIVYDTVAQPSVVPYQAVMRLQYYGDANYQYAQWRQFSGFEGFYVGPRNEAAVFTVSPASTNSSRTLLQFTFDGVLKTVALRSFEQTGCTQDAYNCLPSVFLSTTPSNLYANSANPGLVMTDAFTYPSYVRTVNGLVGRTATGVDIGFNLPGGSIQTFNVDPTGTYGVLNSQLTVDLIPV